VPGPYGRVSFRLTPRLGDTKGDGLLVVTIQVGLDFGLEFLPALTQRRSTIGRSTRAEMLARGEIEPASRSPFRLRHLSIDSQPIPDVEVRVSPFPDLIKVDGMLGADFFRNYSHVNWDPDTNLVTLIP